MKLWELFFWITSLLIIISIPVGLNPNNWHTKGSIVTNLDTGRTIDLRVSPLAGWERLYEQEGTLGVLSLASFEFLIKGIIWLPIASFLGYILDKPKGKTKRRIITWYEKSIKPEEKK